MKHTTVGIAFAAVSVLSAVSVTDTCYAMHRGRGGAGHRGGHQGGGHHNGVNWNQLREAAAQARRNAEQTFNHNVAACRRRYEHERLRPAELNRRAVGRETSNAIRQITLREQYIGRDRGQHALTEIWDGQHVKIYDTQAGNFGGVNILGTNIALAGRDQYQTNYIVSNLDSIRAADQFYFGRAAILNFANATQPGGGFLNGRGAQEESLCRSTTLYASLISQNAEAGYYNYNRGNAYSTRVMVSPDVFVIRDSDAGGYRFFSGGQAYNPNNDAIYEISVLTAAAFRANDVNQANSPDVQAMMKTLVRNILLTAIAERYDTLILGAFGTGVYNHDVRNVAGYFRDALIGTPDNPGLGQYFSRVVFAIPDAQKRRAFEQAFGVQTTLTNNYHLNF